MNQDLDILMTGFFPYALELKFSAVQMSGKSWAGALSNFLGSAIASYPQKLQYMVASGDRSRRNKSAAKNFQKFFFLFCFVLQYQSFFLFLLINVKSFMAMKVSQKKYFSSASDKNFIAISSSK